MTESKVLDGTAPTKTSGDEVQRKFFGPRATHWTPLELPTDLSDDPNEAQRQISGVKLAQSELSNALLASLQMPHLVVLAGSGTSLGPKVNGPSMSDLWDRCVGVATKSENGELASTTLADRVISSIGYSVESLGKNIEALLSRCESFLQLHDSDDVAQFVKASKETILEECTRFVAGGDRDQLKAHLTFLHRLSRRRVRDSRLKVFTTNYDVCFEAAAGQQGLVVIDGFSFTQPRRFDARYFAMDIVRRGSAGDEQSSLLEGVFHLYKLHGSVTWARKANDTIEIVEKTNASEACLIYPARGKYQQSYAQPHLELVSQFFSVLRQPNTCLVVVGFGFNDDHLSEPILAAVRSNPHFRLIVVNRSAEKTSATGSNRYWKAFLELASTGEDVWMINADFEQFAELIPDLKALTPAQRLARDVRLIAEEQ
jgi:hypothetical protein